MNEADLKNLSRFLSDEASDPAAPLLHAGDVVGSWKVTAYLGGGGFGEVYRVEHMAVDLVCALKYLKRDTPASRERFLREANILAQHLATSIPLFYELGEFAGRPYIVMELLEPRELPSKDSTIASLLLQLSDCVVALHAHGYVHRDIKPANVLYRRDGSAVLVDFGLVKQLQSHDVRELKSVGLTKESVAAGTEKYAAPEQMMGGGVSVEADIHALGVLADTCFKGNPPSRWNRIIRQATSSLPKQRYASCSSLKRAIQRRFLVEASFMFWGLFLLTISLLATYMASSFAQRTEPPAVNAVKEIQPKNVSDSAGEWLGL